MIKGEHTRLYLKLSSALKLREKDFVVEWVGKKIKSNPFLLLVSIILSQNTSDKNALRAVENLLEKGLVTPEDIVRSSTREVAEAIRPAGLYNQKALVIKRLSETIVEGKLDPDRICDMSIEEAREKLLGIRGIGVKTADVYLSAYCGMSVFPVDRHILRVTSRVLGRKTSYEEASDYWKKFFREDEYGEAHKLLIQLGRLICKPRSPKCEECPLKEMCATGRRK